MKTDECSFQCIHCNTWIPIHSYMGTSHRNHCPFCLWSLHVDDITPGDRRSTCHGEMEPIGLSYKHEGLDKYGNVKQGELMIIHVCSLCGKININRIAGDDDEKTILALLNPHHISQQMKTLLNESDIRFLGKKDEDQVQKQLFGTKRI